MAISYGNEVKHRGKKFQPYLLPWLNYMQCGTYISKICFPFYSEYVLILVKNQAFKIHKKIFNMKIFNNLISGAKYHLHVLYNLK